MDPFAIEGPIVQVAIDVLSTEAALKIAEAAVRAGVDWLEVGTPLVTFAGTSVIGALSREFPHMPILADYKTMDGSRKYALETKAQGGHLCTVCSVAADATVRAMTAAAKECGVDVVCDLIAAPDVPARAKEVVAMGCRSVYVHWGSDQRVEEPNRDGQADLRAVVEAVNVPVGVATFSVEDGLRAVRLGARIAVVGFPLIGQADVYSELKAYVDAVKSA